MFAELYRITRPGGWVAFEVGEVRRGSVRLEEIVAPLGTAAGFGCEAVLINAQQFTKTANIWGISNNQHGHEHEPHRDLPQAGPQALSASRAAAIRAC